MKQFFKDCWGLTIDGFKDHKKDRYLVLITMILIVILMISMLLLPMYMWLANTWKWYLWFIFDMIMLIIMPLCLIDYKRK